MKFTALTFILFYFFSFSQEKNSNSTLSFQIGSLGIGANYSHLIKNDIDIRLSASFLKLGYDLSSISSTLQIDKKREFRTGGIGLIADWAFIKNNPNFKLSGGVFYQINRIKEERDYTYIKDNLNEKLGLISIAFSSKPISPFLGFTYGNFKSEKKITYAFELGTLYHGKPIVEFIATERLSQTAEQKPIVENNVKNYNFYPVMNVKLIYKLNKNAKAN